MTISVIIPTIPPRARLLNRAFASVSNQTRQADEVIIENDRHGFGAAQTRHRGLLRASMDWVAFLDDDDELLPFHLEHLENHAAETGADLVFPWFIVIGGQDPFPQHFGKQWDRKDPTQTTITFLVRREAALSVGGFLDGGEGGVDGDGHRAGEDFRFVCRLGDAGYKIEHLAERTFRWFHWTTKNADGVEILGNTSGRPWTSPDTGSRQKEALHRA